MYDMDAPLIIMCMYDMNALDTVYKVRLGTWPTQPQKVKHVTFIDLLNLTTYFTEYKDITFIYYSHVISTSRNTMTSLSHIIHMLLAHHI